MRFDSGLVVHLDRLAFNFSEIRKLSPQKEILFMVKADGYGHGASELTHFAFNNCDIKEFGVAGLGEALNLRRALDSLKAEIYVFSDLNLENEQYRSYYTDFNLIPVLSNLSDLKIFLTKKEFTFCPLVMKLNTGMNRLGFDRDELEKAISELKHYKRTEIHHLMTHFSSSSLDIKKNKRTTDQLDNFKKMQQEVLAAGFTINFTSVANSGAIEQEVGLSETHIRPGIMSYGPSSLVDYRHSLWKGKNISTLKTKVLKKFLVQKGTPVGYGAPVTMNDGVMLLLNVGYGDGIPHNISGVKVQRYGFEGQFFGRVNMDMSYLFFPVEAASAFSPNQEFILWDEDSLEINRLSEELGTISYELFCQLTRRLPRIYVK